MRLQRSVTVVDSHTEGNPTRVVIGGVPIPPGETLADRWSWAKERYDGLRHFLNDEPRGSGMMCSVLVMPPISSAADFSVIIMEPAEFVPMCGHCIIGTATTVVALGMVEVLQPVTTVVIEAPAGIVSCEVEVTDQGVGSVTLVNVPSFTLHHDVTVDVAGYGQVPVSVAFGGDFYAIVDGDPLGVQIDHRNSRPLIDLARALIPAVNQQLEIVHPERPDIDRCYETLITTSLGVALGYRHAVVSPPGDMDRSPCGTGTSARLALLYERGEAVVNQAIRFEGLMGTAFNGTIRSVEERAGRTVVCPAIQGRAYLSAMSTLILEQDDPFPQGYRIT